MRRIHKIEGVLLTLAGLGLGVDEPRRPEPGRSDAEPLHGSIHLRIDDPTNPRRRSLRLDQLGDLPPKARDQFRIEARLNHEAYLYVLWLGSDGKVAPIHPWKDQDWTTRPAREEKLERLDLPKMVVDTFPLPPSAPGLETLVLLAREDSPLPRDADATLERDLAGPRTTWVPGGKSEAVWLENGQAFGLDDQGRDREMPGLETRQSDDPVLRIRRLLKEKISTLGPYHRAVIVPNQGGS
jgi:hypothetical protein